MNTKSEPDIILGKKIIEALIQEGIILEEDSVFFLRTLLDGKLKESDWKVALETAINKSETSDNESTKAGA